MTLEQYASLEAELAVGRAPRAALFLTYELLHEAALGAPRADWERKLAGMPEERARLARVLEELTAWVRMRPG